jgi:hypothetical protein
MAGLFHHRSLTTQATDSSQLRAKAADRTEIQNEYCYTPGMSFRPFPLPNGAISESQENRQSSDEKKREFGPAICGERITRKVNRASSRLSQSPEPGSTEIHGSHHC